jgi:hypothetical protein
MTWWQLSGMGLMSGWVMQPESCTARGLQNATWRRETIKRMMGIMVK